MLPCRETRPRSMLLPLGSSLAAFWPVSIYFFLSFSRSNIVLVQLGTGSVLEGLKFCLSLSASQPFPPSPVSPVAFPGLGLGLLCAET